MEQRPPVKAFFSMTVTRKPAFASRAAVATPPTPAPRSNILARISACRIVEHANDDCSLLLLLLSHGRNSELPDDCHMSKEVIIFEVKWTDDGTIWTKASVRGFNHGLVH